MTEAAPALRSQWRVDLDDYVHVLELSPDRGVGVAGSLGGDAVLISPGDGAVVPLERHEMGVLSAAWSADGDRVAVGGQDGLVRLYDRAGGAVATVDVSTWATTMAWSSSAPVLAVGAGRHLVIIDANGAVRDDFGDQPSTVTGVAWSTDGTCVGATAYGGVGWYDIGGSQAGRHRRFELRDSVLSLAMSPNGTWACAGTQDRAVQLWELWDGADFLMTGYPSKVDTLRFSPEGRWLAVACLRDLSLWDFSGDGPVGTAPSTASGHDQPIEDVAWGPSGQLVATGSSDGRTLVWAAPAVAGTELRVVAAAEADAGTSRIRWIDEASMMLGRSDGAVVRLGR
ncbi:MAG: hypothetical protein AAGA37_05815 [Actinomycetota bacterium]